MSASNDNARLEAFCDAVFAIAITLLVIDIKIPETAEITDTASLWRALGKITPSIFAFLLSFCIILITWVNHHNAMKLLHKSCSSYLYANGFLLLTVAFLPFPTSLLGEYLFTDHATPAVIMFDSALSLQAIAWILLSRSALANQLGKSEKAHQAIRNNEKFGYFAFMLYGTFTVLAIWFPLASAAFITMTWIFWLVYGINIRYEQV